MWVRGSSSPTANWAFDVFKLTLRSIIVIRAKSSGPMASLLPHNSFPVFVRGGLCDQREVMFSCWKTQFPSESKKI